MLKQFIGKIATTSSEKIRNVFYTYFAIIAVMAIMMHLYHWTYQLGSGQLSAQEGPGFWYRFLTNCILTPPWEEFAFRVFPIALVVGLGKGLSKAFSQFMLPYVIILAAIIFGWGHGGVEYIYMQGIAGLLLTRLYIKNNDSFLSIVSVHFMWNLTALILSTMAPN